MRNLEVLNFSLDNRTIVLLCLLASVMELSVLPSEEDMALPAVVYRPRHPQDSDYYRCVEDYFETFIQNYDEHFSRQYGFWRPYIAQVIYRYLDAACPVPDTGAICSTVLPV